MLRFLLFVSFVVFAGYVQAQSSPSGCGHTNIVFGNGINTTKDSAKAERDTLEQRFKPWVSARPALGIDASKLNFGYIAYNRSDGLIADLLEVGRQEGFDWVSAWGVVLLLKQAALPARAKGLDIITDALATPPQATAPYDKTMQSSRRLRKNRACSQEPLRPEFHFVSPEPMHSSVRR